MAEEPNTATPPATEPVTTPPAADPAQAPTDGDKPETKALTQAEIDEMISKRVAREKKAREDAEANWQTQLKERDDLLKSYRDKEDAVKREQEEKERKRLEEKGEFEKIIALDREKAERDRKTLEEAKAAAEAERDQLKKAIETSKIDNALLALFSDTAENAEAAVVLFKNKHTVSVDPATKEVVVDGDVGTPLHAKVQQFLAANDYIAKSPFSGKAGAGSAATSPAAVAGATTFSRQQIEDFAFYKAHQPEIDKAVKEGRITT